MAYSWVWHAGKLHVAAELGHIDLLDRLGLPSWGRLYDSYLRGSIEPLRNGTVLIYVTGGDGEAFAPNEVFRFAEKKFPERKVWERRY